MKHLTGYDSNRYIFPYHQMQQYNSPGLGIINHEKSNNIEASSDKENKALYLWRFT